MKLEECALPLSAIAFDVRLHILLFAYSHNVVAYQYNK